MYNFNGIFPISRLKCHRWCCSCKQGILYAHLYRVDHYANGYSHALRVALASLVLDSPHTHSKTIQKRPTRFSRRPHRTRHQAVSQVCACMCLFTPPPFVDSRRQFPSNLPPRPARFLRKPSLEYILYDGNYKHMRSLCGTPLRPSSSLQTNDEIVKCLQKAVAQSYASEASLCASCACLVVCGCVRFPEACLSLACVRAWVLP